MFHFSSSQSTSFSLQILQVAIVLISLGLAYGDYDYFYGDVAYPGTELDYVFTDSNYNAVCPPGGYPVCASDGYKYYPYSSKCQLDSQNLKRLFEGKRGGFLVDYLNFF